MKTVKKPKLTESVRRFNELIGKFNKAEDFFEKYPNYSRTNPKECVEVEKKLRNILTELGELDWLHYEPAITKDSTTHLMSLPIPETQVKLF